MASDDDGSLEDLLGRVSKKLGWQNFQSKEAKSTCGIGMIGNMAMGMMGKITENTKHSHKKKKKSVPRSSRKNTEKSRRDLSSSDKENCSINGHSSFDCCTAPSDNALTPSNCQECFSKNHQAQARTLVSGSEKSPVVSTGEIKKTISLNVEENDLDLSINLSIDLSICSLEATEPAPCPPDYLRCAEETETAQKQQQKSSKDQRSSDGTVPLKTTKKYPNNEALLKRNFNCEERSETENTSERFHPTSSELAKSIQSHHSHSQEFELQVDKSVDRFQVISISDSDADSCDSGHSNFTKATDEVSTPTSKRNDSGLGVPFSPLQFYADTPEPIKWLLTPPPKDSSSQITKLPPEKIAMVTVNNLDKDLSSDVDAPALSLSQRLAKNFKKQKHLRQPATDDGKTVRNSHCEVANSERIGLPRTEEFKVVEPRNLQPDSTLDSDDSDDDFENFLQAIKTPQHTSQRHQPTRIEDKDEYDNSFINDTPAEGRDSDDDVFYFKKINSDQKMFHRKPKEHKEKLSTFSDFRLPRFSDSDDGVFETPRPPKKTEPKQATTSSKRMTAATNQGRATPSHNQTDFLVSLSTPKMGCSSSSPYVSEFKKHREALTQKLFTIYNQTVFDNKLHSDFSIKWNNRMRKTAGYCYYTKTRLGGHCNARIELSEKVCDTAERLRDTLIHELCHAACWVINGVNDGHGRFWKYWAAKANQAHPSLPVIKRCHSYEITTKYKYQCVSCGTTIGRHSKSINTAKFCCALCKGNLVLLPSINKDGTVSKMRTPNKFAMFVKENYGSVKKENSSLRHADIMRLLSQDFSKKAKISV